MAAPDTLTVERLQRALEVSLSSTRRDLARTEPWFGSQGLFVARRPGLGVAVIGTETALRKAMVKLVLEAVPSELLADPVAPGWWRKVEVGAGMREAFRGIPLEECSEIVHQNDTLRAHRRGGQPWFAVDLAIIAFRIIHGRGLSLEPGTLRSLADHPVWETAEAVAGQLARLVGGRLAESEVGGITEHLLGMAQLAGPAAATGSDAGLVARAIQLAAERLHPGLAEDAGLAQGLDAHLERLRVRVRYGLPIHNPLLAEVASRYPEVHATALAIAELIDQSLGLRVPEDEAGFITMYLSGALERLRLRPRTRAVVVCPAGVATAWILVSRIQAEFPELELVQVVAADSFEQRDSVDADLIISTVPIESASGEGKVVVVNPLLPADDVRRLARSL
jgi:mannitol operon transcriptional antiterminator